MIIQTFFLAFYILLIRNMSSFRDQRLTYQLNFGNDALYHFQQNLNNDVPSFCNFVDYDEDNNMLQLSLIFDDSHWILLEVSLISYLILVGNDDSNEEAPYYVKHFDRVGGCDCDACQSCLVKLVDEGGNWYNPDDHFRNRQALSFILQEISAQWHEDQLQLKQVAAINFTNSSENDFEGILSEGESFKSTHNPLHDPTTPIYAAGGGPPYYVGNSAKAEKCK